MKKKLLAALSGAAFFYALGVVGAVEQGAPVGRLWLVLPLLVVCAFCAGRYARTE